MAASFRIETFDKSRHDRQTFRSGIESVDNYLHKTAGKLAKAGNVSFCVLTEIGNSEKVVGFFTLNAHAIHYSDLPKKYSRIAPSHGTIPAAFISMMGVDSSRQGEGIGTLILADALRRIERGSESVKTAVVLLDVVDCGDAERVKRRKQFYEKFGFEPLPSQPMRLFLPVASIKNALP